MSTQRPNHDELLACVQAEEARQARGMLKIFFGATAGVGKTYAMLKAAHERRAEGVDGGAALTHKVAALDVGADDYLTKSFGGGELLARMRVPLRHTARTTQEVGEAVFTVGDLQVDMARRQVSVANQEVHLTPIEYKLLTTLVRYAGKVVTHHQLCGQCGVQVPVARPTTYASIWANCATNWKPTQLAHVIS